MFRTENIAKKTHESTNTWMNVWCAWADIQVTPVRRNPADLNPSELNKHLEKFYVDIRRQDGNEYDPESMSTMIAGREVSSILSYVHILHF